jgi:two-component system LytT family response regulator
MNIAICDDIEEYRNSINNYTNEYLSIHHIESTVDVFENGKLLLNSSTNYDILFLDIELGDTNGIDVAKEILKRNPNTIILIVTSYHQYLDDAMDINVTRYIDKPITKDRIFSSLDKSMSVINENIITLHMKDNKIVRIKLSDIVYVEAKLKRVTV